MCLPDQEYAIHGIWCPDVGDIMCETESCADAIADLLEAMGFDIIHTTYYDDPENDGDYYGWWSVYPDG